MNQNQFLSRWIAPAMVICLLLSSCNIVFYDPYPGKVPESRQKKNIYYVPSAPNTPLLTEKNDMDFNLLRSSGSEFSGIELQAAYLPAKHVGITGSYSLANNRGSRNYMKSNRFELGAGYITKLSRGLHFETYAGAGSGKVANHHHTGLSKTNLTHLFVQPAIAFTNTKKSVTLGFVSRFSGVNFNVQDTSFNNDREMFSAKQVQSLYDQPFHIMWEPGIVLRAGWKKFLFHFSYSFSSDLTDPGLYRSKSNISLGLSLRFNAKAKETSK